MEKEIKRSFVNVIDAAETLECDDLHHKISQLHKYDKPCPALSELKAHIQNIREYMNSDGT